MKHGRLKEIFGNDVPTLILIVKWIRIRLRQEVDFEKVQVLDGICVILYA